MPRLARDETAAIALTAVGLVLVAHRWLLRTLARWVQRIDDARAELDDKEV